MGRQTFLQGETPTWERGSRKDPIFEILDKKRKNSHNGARCEPIKRLVCLSVSEISSASTQMGIISP
jgi:hypothetical protein